MFADVIIDIQHEKLDKIFQYRIPERLEHEVEAGMAVVVPFGKGNRKTKGYVTARIMKTESEKHICSMELRAAEKQKFIWK